MKPEDSETLMGDLSVGFITGIDFIICPVITNVSREQKSETRMIG